MNTKKKYEYRPLNSCCLLIGSNMGNSFGYLTAAFNAIETQVGTIIRVSSIYKTAPWGNTQQNDFYNQAFWIKTPFTAQIILQKCLRIERELGRVRKEKWGPRIIDIDLVFYNQEKINLPQLTIPHPHIQERRFALQCLTDICASYKHPILKKTTLQLLHNCPDTSAVCKVYEYNKT